MALKPVFNLYYIAPQLVMTASISSMSVLISQSSITSNFFTIDRLRQSVMASSICIFIFGYLVIKPTIIESFPLANQLSSSSIIWSDSIGSKLFYYYDLNVAKFNFGSNQAQKEVVDYLSNNNIDQFVLDEGNIISQFKYISSGSLQEFSMFNNLKLYKYIPE